jgi:hypothetical protein
VPGFRGVGAGDLPVSVAGCSEKDSEGDRRGTTVSAVPRPLSCAYPSLD